jgi:hypothetical protein
LDDLVYCIHSYYSMPKNTVTDVPNSENTIEKIVPETLFHFPTVGNGISIRARSLEEAEEIIKKLK